MDPDRLWFSVINPMFLVGLPVVGWSNEIIEDGEVGEAPLSAGLIFTSAPTFTELATVAAMAPAEVPAPEIPVLLPVEGLSGRRSR